MIGPRVFTSRLKLHFLDGVIVNHLMPPQSDVYLFGRTLEQHYGSSQDTLAQLMGPYDPVVAPKFAQGAVRNLANVNSLEGGPLNFITVTFYCSRRKIVNSEATASGKMDRIALLASLFLVPREEED